LPDVTVFDWDGFTRSVADGVARATRELLGDARGQTPFGLALFGFYAETAGVVNLPLIALGTLEGVADPLYRSSPPDWDHIADEWGRDGAMAAWAARLNETVSGLRRREWDRVHHRFESAVVEAMSIARQSLLANGDLAASVVCFVADDEGRLLRRSVTADELAIHFPELAEADRAEEEIGALPMSERVARLAELAGLVPARPTSLTSVGSERATELLLLLGAHAAPIAVGGLADTETRWAAAKFLADLHQPLPFVLAALRSQLSGDDDRPGRNWVANALARLGAGRELLDRYDLPSETVASGVAAPYTPFRDRGVAHYSLDYGLLSEALLRDDLYLLLAERLAAGHGECTLDISDVPGAIAGLDSVHALIRRHAVSALAWAIAPEGDIDLDAAIRAAVRNRVSALAKNDPDDKVRAAAAHEL
jgi:hypothetical protein